jgi:hypothetical protein
MKKSVVLILGFLIIYGCSKKPEPVKIIGWEHFQDPYTRISFTHPAGWHPEQEGTRFSFYSTPEVMARFNPYSAEGVDGARLIVETQKMDTLKTVEQFINNAKTDLISSQFDVAGIESKNIAGLAGQFLTYSGALDAKNTIKGLQAAVIRREDSTLVNFKYEGFNASFADLKAAADTLLASFKLPAPKVAGKPEDISAPSAEFANFDSKYLKLSYPENFSTTFPAVKAPVEYALDVKGYRQDSYIHIDVRPAQGLTTEKAADQNAKFFKATSRGQATISGIPAVFMNYAPGPGLQGKANFLVSNDKLYRIIQIYPANMSTVYRAPFEKVVSSITVK